MGLEIDFFNSMDHLEPKCPACGIKVDYGINTTFNDQKELHICNQCGADLR